MQIISRILVPTNLRERELGYIYRVVYSPFITVFIFVFVYLSTRKLFKICNIFRRLDVSEA